MFTKDELGMILEAVAQQKISAQRQQNAKRGTPTIKEVYRKHEEVLTALEAKILVEVNKPGK